ncbi:hypothetical protein [Paraflavitalea speifideaquila]|uniref:hypothetical protein n=1 Tax=Paraflavitalea speifideaquila TaxID=3076558 RepID=UPI0028F08703|nr:hypothetical protein [Paraflavitalea speifideiaquila]
MPPLCTAGYGLATLKLSFLQAPSTSFLINTVFIALATFITVRFLKFPYKHLPDPKADARANRIIWFIVTLTLIPSIYLGYEIVQQEKFLKRRNSLSMPKPNFPMITSCKKISTPKKEPLH